ncbi:hypothetical protein [Salinirussus salinus]|uniref:hypothetical protein n=1 Tax=Salinirussus salinus TaxID=1198300 RepID=UPI00135B93A2|nr:hypothetical protein [Salinirussus salinus]
MSDSDGPGRREVAHRLFAAEFEDADLSYSESDEERAPNYVVTPSGARVNRLFAVGVLTEVEQVSEDVLRGRVVDPTGAFVLYAGQYQPDEQAFLDRAEPPMFVAVTGKARTFQPDDADTVYTSVRPETISEVDADTRDRWTVDAAERTLDRVATFAAAARMDERGDALASALGEQGIDESLAEGIALALEHYGTTGTYLAALRELALDAARVVAGQREEVEPLTVDPGAGDDGALADLAADLEGGEDPTEPAATPEAGTDVEDETAATPTGEDGVETAETTASAGTDSDESTEAAEPSAATTSGTAAATDASEAAEATGATEVAETTETAGATAESTAGSDATAEDAGEATGTEAVGDADSSGDIGDFEGGALGSGEAEEAVDDFEPEEFELDEEEREEIEEEYGTDFQSGAEVDEPGEAGIETPDTESEMTGTQSEEPAASGEPEPEPEPEAVPEPDTTPESGAGADTETGTDAGGGADDGGGEDTADTEALEGEELEDAVVDLMGDLDEGDGVAREELVGAATEQYGADAGAVEDAIQDALMGGRCYEPDDGTLKPI